MKHFYRFFLVLAVLSVFAGCPNPSSSDSTIDTPPPPPPPGSLDTNFDTDGIVTTAIGTASGYGKAVAIQSDGKIVVAGYSHNGSNFDFALARYTTDGTLDATFGTGGKVTTAIGTGYDQGYSIAIQSDGKIVVAGYSRNASNDNGFALARYNANGTLDNSFDTDGIVTTAIGTFGSSGNAVAIQSDGKIVVAGYSHNGSDYDISLTRYTTNGTLDTSFDTDGIITTAIGESNDSGLSVAIQSDGKIVVAGTRDSGSGSDFALARYWP